jgi:hypothetical protein
MMELFGEDRPVTDFRTTVWPGDPIPPPLVGRFVAIVHPDGIKYELGNHPESMLPRELVLREVPKVDPDDTDALLAFIDNYGALTSIDGPGLGLLPMFAEWYFEKEGVEPYGRIPIAVLRYHLRALRALVAHWQASQEGDDEGTLAAWTDLMVNECHGRPITSMWFACYLWESHMNAALSPLSAHVVVRASRRPHHLFQEKVYLSAYTAMVVEIFNDVTTGTTWRKCANETCPNGPDALFARQLGADKKTERVRMTGVIYCSRTCAKAQVERVRRRKKAQQRKGEREHA